MSKAIAPAVSHTGSVGGNDRVYGYGYFDNISDGTVVLPAGAVAERMNPRKFLQASGKRQLTIMPGTGLLKPDGTSFSAMDAPVVVDLDISPMNGTDYYVHVSNAGTILVSPTKITDGSAALIGGFHTLCADAGTGLTYVGGGATLPHPLDGYVAGDILPQSVWCLNHRPYSEPEGMVFIDSMGIWCDIYLASGTGINTKSAYKGVITYSRQIGDFIEDFMLVKKTLLDDTEFAAAMLGSNEQTATAGASPGDYTAGGRLDTAGRRMISIHGVEEGCGMLWQFLREITTGGTAAWATQSGGKGQFYQCNVVFAGGAWSYGALCGSRCRYAFNARSHAVANVGGRGRSRHVSS